MTSAKSSNESSTQDVVRAQEAVNEVLLKAEISFKEGLLAFRDNKRSLAGAKFNHAVEVFLYSTLNLQREPKLQNCYNQLVETVYRIEFPFRTQVPQIKALATSCSWKLDDLLAEKVSRLVLQSANQQYALTDEEAKIIIESKNNLDIARREFDAKSRSLAGLMIIYGHGVEPKLAKARAEYDKAFLQYSGAFDAYSKLSKRLPEVKDYPSIGFDNQKFEPSPIDDLSRLELTDGELRMERNVTGTKPRLIEPSGPKPVQAKNGRVPAVINYFNETLHDPYSMRFVRWSPVTQVYKGSSLYWSATVKYRAKNTLGAYVLNETTFYIRYDRVVTPYAAIIPETTYSRPTNVKTYSFPGSIRTVKARAGDTVQRLAERNNANPTEVAKFNGLLPNSVLGAGREIKIPSK